MQTREARSSRTSRGSGNQESCQIRNVARRACLSTRGKPVKNGEAEMRGSVDMLSGASYPVWGRRASKELPVLRQEVLERSATASLVEAGSNTQHGGASNEEGTTPSCVDSPSCSCVQGGAGVSADAWECVFSGRQSWAPCRSFCPMAQVVCTKGDTTPNSKLRPSSVERSLYVLSAVSMEQNEQRRALSGVPIVCDSNKPGNGFVKPNKVATLHLKSCRNLSNQPGPPLLDIDWKNATQRVVNLRMVALNQFVILYGDRVPIEQ